MSTHDGAYKHIFSHAQIVRDLLTGFVRESWVGLLERADKCAPASVCRPSSRS